MNEKELLNQFLNAFPDSTHPLDKAEIHPLCAGMYQEQAFYRH